MEIIQKLLQTICMTLPSQYSGQNYVVAIKASAAGSPSKPAIPTPSKKPTVAGKSTGPTVATPTTSAKASGQSAIEAKVST